MLMPKVPDIEKQINIEISFKLSNIDPKELEEFSETIEKYTVYRRDERLVLCIPLEWDGFKNGDMQKIYSKFGENVYIALAFFTQSDDIIVSDLDGNLIESYKTSFNGVPSDKYVKKRFHILKIVNSELEIYHLFRVQLDINSSSPAVISFYAYSLGRQGGIPIQEFIRRR